MVDRSRPAERPPVRACSGFFPVVSAGRRVAHGHASAGRHTDSVPRDPCDPWSIRLKLTHYRLTRVLAEVDRNLLFLHNGGMSTLNIKDFPDSLYRKLQARARRQRRSVAQEVTRLLSEAIAAPPPLSILDLRGLGRKQWKGVDAGAHVEKERSSWD